MTTITAKTAESTITIRANPISFISPNASSSSGVSFTPNPVNEALVDVNNSSFFYANTAVDVVPIGGITYQNPVNINVGQQTNSLIPQLLNAYQYKFDNFTLHAPNEFEMGDVVYFTSGTNEYNSLLQKARIDDTTKGAYNNLFIFISYSRNTLQVMHKGYLEIPNSKMSTWNVGRSIYLNSSSLLDITPVTTSGAWVRSLGFCIPNNTNKKIIWFEPDSTYLKII